ncbi:uncharacterized protein I206_105382 [Kwoniella pini CBS 10737]|uniref:Sensitive to high expression protein 9, mitochondrial n=1 Tax=Kwoniella pini CBS 10737 TaxID=1296096 RepID=A0A1B9I4E6_9TREE|nr:uncharacterized protein I206_03711 [Kwoniella pini CBS 10737]OCF50390.1 hypothetical protein I206_03711 [Kwoniella pini CBS 10737]
MAFRHVFSSIPSAVAGPSRLPRLMNTSSSRSLSFQPRCLASLRSHQHMTGLRRYASSSTASPQSIDEDKPERSASPSQNEFNSQGGLPIPGNIATSSTSFSGTGSTAGHDKSATDATQSAISKRQEQLGSDASSELPNYPTLPSSSKSSYTSPNFASPNIPSLGSSSKSASINGTSAARQFRLPQNVNIPPEVRERISEWSTNVLQHSKRVAKDAEKRLVDLGLKVNQMTGYQEVERLKALVFEKEDHLQKLRESARSAKSAYDEAVSSRSDAQRDVNTLLERKHSWSDSDVLKFTQLVRQDHSSSHLVGSTSIELKEAELKVDKAFNELMQTILQRYHEEQVWSDKIRSVSTWANLMGLALNAIIFLGAIIIVEPWKRKRLVSKLEERISEMMNNVDASLKSLERNLKGTTTTTTIGDLEMIKATKDNISTELSSALSTIKQEEESTILENTPMPIHIPRLDTPVPLSDTRESTRTVPVILNPIIKTNIEGLPSYLDPITRPSQERDMAVAGMTGAILMGIITTTVKWLIS